MGGDWPEITIDEMADELVRAGSTKKTSTIWRAPNGTLHLGPAGAWRKLKRTPSVFDQRAQATGRVLIIRRAMKLRVEIEQIFTDAASWNDNARQPGDEPIDADPDGKLRRIADGLDRMLEREASL